MTGEPPLPAAPPMTAIRSLSAAETREERAALAGILVDCVEGGDSLGFMSPFPHDEAERYWLAVAAEIEAGGTLLLVAETGDGTLAGTVQLCPAGKPNQTHRADVKKLLVRSRFRRRGFAKALMAAAEQEALSRGRWLLCLDSATGSVAERMYPALGWRPVGTVPDYAMWPDGAYCDSTFFHKCLDPDRVRS